MINHKLKLWLLRQRMRFVKNQWQNRESFKILISTSTYFDKTSWERVLSYRFNNKNKTELEWIYCKNYFEVAYHFPEADACFLHGFGILLQYATIKPKLLYFPMQGLDNLPSDIVNEYSVAQPDPITAKPISEYCLSMALLLQRNFHTLLHQQFKRIWKQKTVLSFKYTPLEEQVVGILGVGKIGSEVAHRFKQYGCKVYGCDKLPNSSIQTIDKWYGIDQLHEFLRVVDVLIIALPGNPETEGIIGHTELELFGSDSYLINISRGGIVKEDILYNALKSGLLKGAAFDVFQHEPLRRNNKLFRLRSLIITPHIAGNINLFIREIQEDFTKKVSMHISQ